jgi:hypothetical protein
MAASAAMKNIREATSLAADQNMSTDEILSSFEKDLPEMDKLAGSLTLASATDMVDQTCSALIECARHGLKNEEDGKVQSSYPDFTCAYCLAHFIQPTTVMSGDTLCQGCVDKYIDLNPSQGIQNKLKFEKQRIGFGTSNNVLLNSISKNIMHDGHRAAQLRLDGNASFRAKDYGIAIGKYSEAVQACPQDIVLYSNRAAARTLISDYDGAKKDVHTALYLCKIQGVGKETTMHRRCISRLIAILEALNKKAGPGASVEMELLAAYAIAAGCGTDHEAEMALPDDVDKQTSRYKRKLNRLLGKVIHALKRGNERFGETATSIASPVNDMLKLYPLQVLGHSLCKREHMTKIEQQGSEANVPARQAITLDEMKSVREELDCPLCFNLLYHPTVLPCGHVLCRLCLARTLDHRLTKQPSCPLCRHDLVFYADYLNRITTDTNRGGLNPTLLALYKPQDGRALRSTQNAPLVSKYALKTAAGFIYVCGALQALIERHFPEDFAQRCKDAENDEAAAAGKQSVSEHGTAPAEEIPIFICNVAFPGVQNPLHVFEPRYRLMMRRCVESGNPVFGMTMHTNNGGAEYGTLLRILSFNQLPDGRSQINCIGEKRFRVLKYGMKDGYSVGNVEWIVDSPELKLAPTVVDYFTRARNTVLQMLDYSARRDAVEMQLGVVPENPSEFMFWCVAAHPIFGLRLDPSAQYQYLYGEASRCNVQKRAVLFYQIFSQLGIFAVNPNLNSED